MTYDIPVLLNNIISAITSFILTTGVKILIAIVIFFVGMRLIKWLQRHVESKSNAPHTDKTVMKTLAYLIGIALRVLLIIFLIGYLGFDTSSLTAFVASFGVCVGLAVNGALGNIAGGVLLIVTRPFRIDDTITVQGITGKVADIRLTCTKIVTPENKSVFIPNGALSSGNVINYSMNDTRRIDFVYTITNPASVDRAKTLISAICEGHELILDTPAPFVRISTVKGSVTELAVQVWVKKEDFTAVNFDVIETSREAFAKAGIDQLDVKCLNP